MPEMLAFQAYFYHGLKESLFRKKSEMILNIYLQHSSISSVMV